MRDYQERVWCELQEVEARYFLLCKFIQTNGVFVALPGDEQERLRSQAFIMGQYIDVLRRRIANFPIEDR